MPHSSGGGSHGGGSHGGSHHSSHSHGGSGRSSRHVRSTYFPDARRYVYYDHHRPVYVYADYDITEKRSPLRFLMLLFYLPFILFTFSMFAEAYHHPHKLPQNYDYKIVVEDKANVLGNTAELRNSLVAFYNRTGISPAVITVENSDWQGYYSDLENYAYDLYVNHFADESHWLIVYSTPDGYSSSDGFEDWYWEGMQGNDTDDVLTESVTNSFNDELQKNLTARTRYTVSSAISTSFDDLTPTVMKSKVNWTMLFTSIAILAFVCLHACLMIGINPKARKYAKAKPCSDAAQEKACEYCGYTYVVDTCTECPHCGAPIPPEESAWGTIYLIKKHRLRSYFSQAVLFVIFSRTSLSAQRSCRLSRSQGQWQLPLRGKALLW